MSQLVNYSIIEAGLRALADKAHESAEAQEHLTKQSADRGLTYSNLAQRRSVLAIGKGNAASIINTIGHELLHVVAHICEQDHIDMFSEEPCYMMGSLCEQFFKDYYPPKA